LLLNMQSEIDLLKQENARLMARINELEQIAKEKDELEVRIVELERTTKLSQTENAELKNEIAKLKRAVKNIEKQNHSSTHHEADQSMTSTDLVTSEQVVNTISNTSNLNETCSGKSKSLEDKEIDVFLDSENKKRVSNEIRQRNMGKRLFHSNEVPASQDQDLSLVNQDASTGSEKTITSLSLCDAKTVTKCHDLNNSDTTSEILESDNQIVEGLIQEMTYDQAENIVSSEINPLYSNNDEDMALDSVQSLSDLFDKAIKSGQKQILNWYYYSLEFENKVKSLIADGKIKEKTARSKIYKEMKPFLPNITDANLHKKTERARKILRLFGKGGVGDSKTVTKCHDQINVEVSILPEKVSPETSLLRETVPSIPSSHTSNSENKISEKNKSLPETEASISNETHISDSSSLKLSQKKNPEIKVGASSNPTHDHAYFHNKILWRYSDLYKEFSSEKFDYYGIHEGSLCPVCKQIHEEGKSIKGRYKTGESEMSQRLEAQLP
ncbi:10715_t:CDS:2, partial [Entrophospora sp. SA101]